MEAARLGGLLRFVGAPEVTIFAAVISTSPSDMGSSLTLPLDSDLIRILATEGAAEG
jgi:hypothetical protein